MTERYKIFIAYHNRIGISYARKVIIMGLVIVTKATRNDIDWVNSKYGEINFVTSNYENEHIVIATVNNIPAGLGRLIKINATNCELGGIYTFPNYRSLGVADSIVSDLLKNNPFKNTTIWCLPFENLFHFYSKFGFNICKHENAPIEIIKKLTWCNTNSTYSKKVLLLCK